VDIGAMYTAVATGTPLEPGVEHTVESFVGNRNPSGVIRGEIPSSRVALQAQLPNRVSNEKGSCCGAMGFVTGDAAVGISHLVLEKEGSFLLYVTSKAGLLAPDSRVQHSGSLAHTERRRETPVSVVAVRAFHQTFIHAMFGGHAELGADIAVALIAEFRLSFCEEIPVGRRMVIGVAGRASYIVPGMFRPADVCPVEVLGMAVEASFNDLSRLHERERPRNGRPAAAGQDVGLGGSMAPLAGRTRRRLFAGGETFEMWIFIERLPLSGVALATFLVARISGADWSADGLDFSGNRVAGISRGCSISSVVNRCCLGKRPERFGLGRREGNPHHDAQGKTFGYLEHHFHLLLGPESAQR